MVRLTSKIGFAFLILAGSVKTFAAEETQVASAEQQHVGAALAAHLVESSGIARGFYTVLGSDNGDFLADVAEAGEILVHGWDSRSSSVAAAREAADALGIYGTRVFADRGPSDRLPYADNTVDVILAPDLTADKLTKLSAREIVRALRPGGRAVLGRAQRSEAAPEALAAGQLETWLEQAELADAGVHRDDFGLWATIVKPPLEGVDDWSHWEHSPDNNPVSQDAVIQAPYMTKWLGTPYYISMPAITTAAGGRIFNAIGHIAHHKREESWLNTILARNGYNGTILWSRKLPDGYLVHRSAFIATDDVFYMIDTDGSGCLVLDPETGQEKDRIEIPGAGGQWKWIAMQNGILFALVGKTRDPAETTIVRSELPHWSWSELSTGYYSKRVPWGFGETLVAYDLAAGKRLWMHRENSPIDSRAMVLGNEKVYFYSPDARLGCLEMKSGKLLWENPDRKVRTLIEQEGRGLTSTPGFRSMSICVFTPEALIFQGQTRMNVVAVSTADGYMLWTRKKTSNNPNALFIDNGVALGIGEGGGTLLVDPHSGETLKDLGFKKRSCARLTATSDSLFCRGWPEGLTRYNRNEDRVMFNGAVRPGCNDGVVAANGLLYVGPWPCDCNLMLLGRVALMSAGDFKFDPAANDADPLEVGEAGTQVDTALDSTPADWPTYRAGNARSAGTTVETPSEVGKIWAYSPAVPTRPTAATSAGGLIFLAGDNGKVQAVEAVTGRPKWSFLTGGPILHPPSIWNGRAFVGSGDGYVYALEAATGRMLYRFRAAPVERRMPVYDKISSTWPVHSGVLLADGVAYAAAGIIDYDGTYVFALDAETGNVVWRNSSSGHLDPDLRKGVSAHGDLTLAGGRIWMPGGNVVSPAAYDLATGQYVGTPVGDGSPQSNRGEEIGIFRENFVVLGGRLRFSPIENVVNSGSFVARAIKPGTGLGEAKSLHQGTIAPAWNDRHMIIVDGRNSVPACYTSDEIERSLNQGGKPKPLWLATALQGGDTVALAVTPNAVLAVSEMPQSRNRHSHWIVAALDIEDGSLIWQQTLPDAALSGGLTVDRDGRILVVLLDGRIVCLGDQRAVREHVTLITEQAGRDPAAQQAAARVLIDTLKSTQNGEIHDFVINNLKSLGIEIDDETRRSGGISRWHLIGPFPWSEDNDDDSLDKLFLDNPDVDTVPRAVVDGHSVKWRSVITDDPDGMVDLASLYGPLADVAVYAYAEVELREARDLLLKIGSNDGFKCWMNGKEVGRHDGGRGYSPDQDVLPVRVVAGRNRVLLKVTQLGSRWAFGARLTDREGRPIPIAFPSE